ncbi:MAG: hypothetical protein ACXWX9_01090 [Actinomycetota bacterium]
MRVRSSGGSPTVAAHAASDPGARIAPGSLVLGALLVAAVAQVARTLFPAVYLIGEDGSFALAGIAALAIYAAPVLAMTLVSLDGRTRLIAGTLLIVVARLAVQFAHPIPPWLAMVATAAVLVGAALAAGADVRRRSALAVTVVLASPSTPRSDPRSARGISRGRTGRPRWERRSRRRPPLSRS